jgi:hypothetical protein
LVSAEQAHAALTALGLKPDEAPAPGMVKMSRAQAMGYLLFTVEGAALLDFDRLDAEEFRQGYMLAAGTVAKSLGAGAEDIDATGGFVFTRLLEDRLRRTVFDLADTVYRPDPAAWSAYDALDALLNAALDLLAPASPPDPGAVSPDDGVLRTRDSLRAARRRVQAARQHIEDGRKTIKHLGFEP